MSRVVVYDLETLRGAFTYTGIDVKTKEIFQFAICNKRNDLTKFISHLLGKEMQGMIGYNNNGFDYPILHYILHNYSKWLGDNISNDKIVELIYEKAQEIIINANTNPLANYIKPQDIHIKQLDLYKMWHFDNHAKATSLKALEISMNYPNVVDMPIDHKQAVLSDTELEEVLSYNLNDVLATLEFYYKSKDKIELRKILSKQYDLPCLSWNNGKIGEQLLLKLYCEKTGKDPYKVKKLRTERPNINLGSCIPDDVKFNTDLFEHLLDYFKGNIITSTKDSISYSIYNKDIRYDYGTGGIHGCVKPGLYEEDSRYMIIDADVGSLYPNIALKLGIFPKHLGPELYEVYKKEIVDVRMAEKAKPKDKQNKAIIDGFKEAANIPYGKSSDKYSFLYDPLYTMKTTIAGQLYISMLIERLSDIPDSQILQANTDGITIRLPRIYKKSYEVMCENWQIATGLVLEFAEYKKMWIADINNYGALTVFGKVKNKGRFEVDKKLGDEPAYHKDNSFRIIPLAIERYFSRNIPIEDTIYACENIYDFCGRQKFKGQDYGSTKQIIADNLIEIKQQKHVRYYISHKGGTFWKNYKKGSVEAINKGYTVTIFNSFISKKMHEYNIDYSFYIKECIKEIDNINKKQMKLDV